MSEFTNKMKSNFPTIIAIGCNLVTEKAPSAHKGISIDAYFESILCELPFENTRISRTYATEAFPRGSGPDFRNNVVEIRTDLSPTALLSQLHEVENHFDRERPYRWSPRTCDIDLLFYQNQILPNKKTWSHWAGLDIETAMKDAPSELICPHPRLQERAFVLGPLCDIAPDLVHPVLGKTMRELWDALPDDEKASIKPVDRPSKA